ncbi:transcription factor atoh8 [Megalobrama amblycephala]|uniref:transcription factor atoh8 n=1 Tax=Megalobrama amblycephala TaxID=75352 RepID=UPI002013D5B6|nr:transcription factor atoh8 [Megalobrama amblycephala]
MKNPHLNGHCKILNTVSGDKKLKRKARDPIKRASDDHLPYFKLYKNSHLMAETLGDSCPKETHGSEIVAASGENELLNTAVDMRINTVISGEIPDSKLRSISEKTVNNKIAKTSSQVSGLSSSQVFPLERVVLSQRAASQAPAASGISESAESPRRRAGEQSGVVTEIKAIQQTRRLLANARERTRVHTISAAFEALRKQVPCYSYGQKLSKLAILRIACNYILSLAQLADLDYTPDHRNMSFRECVEQCTRTLQAEGRSKKRKE